MFKEIEVKENIDDVDLFDPYQLLRKDVLSYDLLDAEEERSLFRIYVFGKKCKKEFNEDIVKNSGDGELLLEHIQKGINAREKLINSNLRLVLGRAFIFSGTDKNNIKIKDDVIHNFFSGCEGLIKAVEKFDPERGTRLSTYARPKITKAITENLRWKNIYAPRWIRELTIKYLITMESYQIINGKMPDDDYIIKKMDITQEKLDTVRDAYATNVGIPLDKNNNDDNDDDGQADRLVLDSYDSNFFENYYGLLRPTESSAMDDVLLSELNTQLYKALKEKLNNYVKIQIFVHMFILGETNQRKIAKDCNVTPQYINTERAQLLKILKSDKEFVSYCLDYLGVRY